jgi:hypothetical protein
MILPLVPPSAAGAVTHVLVGEPFVQFPDEDIVVAVTVVLLKKPVVALPVP